MLKPAKLSLFVADILQAIGASLDVRWVHRGIVEEGGYCNAQGKSRHSPFSDEQQYQINVLGAIQQLGETVVALAILVCILCYQRDTKLMNGNSLLRF